MKELLCLLKEVNQVLREERDTTVQLSKSMVAKLEGVALRCVANRRLDMLHQKLKKPA